jgi:hypothetical protein
MKVKEMESEEMEMFSFDRIKDEFIGEAGTEKRTQYEQELQLSLDELKQHTPVTLGDFGGILSEEEALQLKKHTQQARKEWDRDF